MVFPNHISRSMIAWCLVVFLLSEGAATIDVSPDSIFWDAKAQFPGGGRHHPITFANTTTGFVLSGSTWTNDVTSDFWMYCAECDTWTNLTGTPSAFPGPPRSFGYGVASTANCDNTKAYVGFGLGENNQPLADLWEFDMATHVWKQLADLPGNGRKHPAMNFVEAVGEIHVGLGDGFGGNYNDYWAYSIASNEWRQLQDFPSTERHHPFYFVMNENSYLGLGHSNGFDPYIERDWYKYNALSGTWNQENDFASYSLVDSSLVTNEARVAGTQFSISNACGSPKTLGFVLSGDGSNHGTMATGEFHVFDGVAWKALPPHPGYSRWAPGSFVLTGSTKAYILGGYDRQQQILFGDLWTIDLASLFDDLVNPETVALDSTAAESNASRNWSIFGVLSFLVTMLSVTPVF